MQPARQALVLEKKAMTMILHFDLSPKRYYRLIGLLLFALGGLHNHVYSQGLTAGEVDYSGVERFWPLMNELTADQQPAENQWDSLFATPAYAYIIKSEKPERIKNRFRTAYMPSMADRRAAVLEEKNYDSMIIRHLLQVRKDQKKILRYADSLRQQDIITEAVRLTQEYLPDQFVKENQDLYPPLAFGIFEPDGKAGGEMIAVDIAFARNIDFHKFLAHEAHHFFLSKIRWQMKEAAGGMEQLLRSIRQLHLEGIADLIDKKGFLSESDELTEQDNWYIYHYRRHYHNARSTFGRIDSLLAAADTPKQMDQNGKMIWSALHFGTHPEALHMALLIEDVFGKAAILEVLDNPFDYFRLYRQAALQRPERGWVFSEKTMSLLDQLEKEYLIREALPNH